MFLSSFALPVVVCGSVQPSRLDFVVLKKLSIFVLINIFCGLERSLHPFGPDFDTVLNSLLLSDSTLTNNGIRNMWVTEAKYSCAIIELRWFAIEDLVAVQAPVKEKNIWIFPCWSRDVVS